MTQNNRLIERSSSEAHIQWLKENLLTRIRDVIEGRAEPTQFATALALEIDKLEQDRIRDPLTGAFNRGFMGAVLGQEIELSKSQELSLGFLLLDIDHFKSINDKEPGGHAAGDRVLIELTKLLKDICGKQSLVGRWGGEEFVVITPHVTPDSFIDMAEDIGETISGWLAKRAQLVRPQVTPSIGAALAKENEEPKDLIQRADDLMYKAKHTGRARLIADKAGEEVVIPFT